MFVCFNPLSSSPFRLLHPGWQPFEENSFHDAFKSTSFTRRVTEECHEAQVPVLVLTVFCAAGMTVPHAIKLAEGIVHFAETTTTERQGDNRLDSTALVLANLIFCSYLEVAQHLARSVTR